MACCFAVKSAGAESIYLGVFGENPQIIIEYIQSHAETQRKDIYRNSGAGSVGAISGGRQRGQRPASAVSPAGETETHEDIHPLIFKHIFCDRHITETQHHHIQQNNNSAEGGKMQT